MSTRRRRAVREPGANRERGASATEGAIVAPLFLALLFGIFEVGALMMHRSAIGEAAAAAARTGTVAVNDADADYIVLKRLVAGLPTDRSSLRYAIVYKAASLLDKAPPTACIASAEAGGSGVAGCNVYQRAVVIAPDPARFGYDPTLAPTATADQNWPARLRHSDYSAGSDFIGVFVSTDYRSISGVIPKHRYSANAVLPLESRAV